MSDVVCSVHGMDGAESEHADNLHRVSARIGPLILSFARDRMAIHRPCFHMAELMHFVARHEPVAPASTDRILRDLRARGLLDYRVTNRRLSLYEITNVRSAS